MGCFQTWVSKFGFKTDIENPKLEKLNFWFTLIGPLIGMQKKWVFLRLQLCIKEMHWNYTWLQLYSWSFDAFSSNSYNAWHLLIRCRWQSFRYFQLKLSKNILCTLSAYQSMHHHTKQLVKKLSDGAFPPENIPPHYGLCYSLFQLDQHWSLNSWKCINLSVLNTQNMTHYLQLIL